MKDRSNSLYLYIGIFVIAIIIGGNIIGYAFTGLVTLLSFVAVCESVPAVKWIVAKTSHLVDVLLFAFAVYAKVHFGVSIAMALLFATTGYTLLYAPYVRETYNKTN
jgi:hypothetical protein